MDTQNSSNISEPISHSQTGTQAPSSRSSLISILIAVLVTLVLSGPIFGLGGYYLGRASSQPEIIEQDLNNLEVEAKDEISLASPTPAQDSKSLAFSEALTQFCINNQIALDNLPFTLDQSLLNAYTIQSSISCFVPEEDYARVAIRVEEPNFSGDIRSIYFYHQGSKYMGMGNPFQPLTNFRQVAINGQTYWLDIREPDPYGISTLGIWVDLIGEKQDPLSGTIVRVINFDIVKDTQYLDLVKKYGTQVTMGDDNTIYVVNDPTKKTQFIDEILRLIPQDTILNKSAQNLSSDLNGVSFK